MCKKCAHENIKPVYKHGWFDDDYETFIRDTFTDTIVAWSDDEELWPIFRKLSLTLFYCSKCMLVGTSDVFYS